MDNGYYVHCQRAGLLNGRHIIGPYFVEWPRRFILYSADGQISDQA